MSITFQPLNIAILTLSDTRNHENDKSGNYLKGSCQEAGHNVLTKEIITDDKYKIRAKVSNWIADEEINAIITTGGTGFAGRDNAPEALIPLLDKSIDGFGELFRYLSFIEIGNSTVQSRACAGIANSTLIFSLPGSSNACKTAWQGILKDQLDNRHKPCNFVSLLPRYKEDPNTISLAGANQ